VTGKVDPNGPVENMQIPYGQVLPPVATTNGAATGNLSADALVGDSVETQITMYDKLGNPHDVSYIFTKTAANKWDVDVKDGATSVLAAPVNIDFTASNGLAPSPTSVTTASASWGAVVIDLSKVTQYGGKASVTPTTPVGAGSALGTLESFALSGDGTVTGVYSNGLRKSLGQLALATFANPSGLTKAGNSSYRVGDNSGNALVGTAGTGGRGTLTAGALEMSNVDLSEEFTGLIVAQRGFQANSKVITTSDEILQTLVNMKN
jgi:flagellar hook protein FlgE